MKNNAILGGVLAMAILLFVGLACSDYGTKLDYSGGELYYTKNANEADAKKLGDFLVKEKVFNGGEKKTVQLDKSGGTYQVRMVIIAEKQNDQAYQDILKTFAEQISTDVFANAPTEIHMCDSSLKTLHVVKP